MSSDKPERRGQDASASSVLSIVRPLAAYGVASMLCGRALGPSARGLGVGLGRLGEMIELTGAIASQFFLVLATVGTLALGFVALRSRLSSLVRFSMIGVGILVVFATLSASASRLPPASLLLVGGASCLFALIAAWDTRSTPFARVASSLLALLSFGGIARLVSVLLVMPGVVPERVTAVARGAATAGLVFDGLAMVIAVGFVASQGRKTLSPTTLLALGVALFATRYAIAGTSDDAGAVSVLLSRSAQAMTLRPEPFFTAPVTTFVAFAAPMIAIAAVTTRTLTPALQGAIALLLVARGAPDVPLCALTFTLASIATVLAARDHRGLWAEISRQGTASPAPTPVPVGRTSLPKRDEAPVDEDPKDEASDESLEPKAEPPPVVEAKDEAPASS